MIFLCMLIWMLIKDVSDSEANGLLLFISCIEFIMEFSLVCAMLSKAGYV